MTPNDHIFNIVFVWGYFYFFMYSLGCDIKQELSLVKNKIYSELIANKGIYI